MLCNLEIEPCESGRANVLFLPFERLLPPNPIVYLYGLRARSVPLRESKQKCDLHLVGGASVINDSDSRRRVRSKTLTRCSW